MARTGGRPDRRRAASAARRAVVGLLFQNDEAYLQHAHEHGWFDARDAEPAGGGLLHELRGGLRGPRRALLRQLRRGAPRALSRRR